MKTHLYYEIHKFALGLMLFDYQQQSLMFLEQYLLNMLYPGFENFMPEDAGVMSNCVSAVNDDAPYHSAKFILAPEPLPINALISLSLIEQEVPELPPASIWMAFRLKVPDEGRVIKIF